MNIHLASSKLSPAKIVCLFLCLAGFCLLGCHPARANEPTPAHYTTTFPYFPEFVNGKDEHTPLVQVRLDNNTTATFAFDTGSGSSFISETQAKKLGIPFKPIPPEERARLPNGTTDYVLTNILIGGVQLPNVPMVILKDQQIPSGEQPVDGILGHNFLSVFLVMFDAARHEITLTTPGGVTADDLKQLDMTDATMINMTEPGLIKRDWVHVQMNNSFHVASQDMIVDTGAAGTLISLATAKQLGLTLHKVLQGWSGYSGNVPASKATVERMRIGDLVLTNQDVYCTMGPDPTYSMSLGMDVLKNYRMLLDYKNMKMYLKPNPWLPPASTDTLPASPSTPGSVPSLALPAGK